MIAVKHEVKKANELVREWGRLRRHPSTAVERVKIARQAQALLRWIEMDMQELVDGKRGSDRDALRTLNALYELREKLRRIINEVY